MTHIQWVVRQNKLEIPRDKDEVNNREIHECDGWSHDPDTMVAPLTPKPTHSAEVLVRTPSTIASCREEDVVLRKWTLTRYCWARYILETKTKVGNTVARAPVPRINPNIDETTTAPKSPTHPSQLFIMSRMRWASARPRGEQTLSFFCDRFFVFLFPGSLPEEEIWKACSAFATYHAMLFYDHLVLASPFLLHFLHTPTLHVSTSWTPGNCEVPGQVSQCFYGLDGDDIN